MADGSGPVAVMAGPAQNEVAAAPDLGDAIKFEAGWTCLCGQHSTVNVEARTWANINKHGGVGRIVKYNGDATYAVRYLLGGGEKSVDMCYITCNAEGGGKREAKVRELYDPVEGVRRPSRHSFATPVATDDTAPPRKSQPLMPVKDSRKNAVPAPQPEEEEAPVAKKAKVAEPKAKRPLQTDEENQEPDRQAQQPAPVAVSKRTPKPGKPPPPVVVVRPKVVKPVPEVVHKSQCAPSPPRPSQPCQMEVVVTDEDDDSEPEMSQPQEPGLLSSISDERRKEFKVCMSEAFGHSDAITVDELRAACGGFSKEELDVLIGMVEKEGRIFIDGDRVYWC